MKLAWYKTTINKLSVIPEKPGVYILSTELTNGEYGVIYVGQSKNLNKRISQHFDESETNLELRKHLKKNYTHKISYAECDNKYLDPIEKYLIEYFNPIFNLNTGNGDEILKVSLPNVVKYVK